ncbi:hypothetical protein [Actinomadura sp. 7K507]|uniref:hypothetical protein n=1 Tax=Actinomadura sp. 7K507 TaxID=2530365 RepID=UPI0010463671|nr:hypothetical protein [Actinomadura sp. 7K507]TDC93061.1 hypothetical protein E1285_10545 [Actinomadura sp. 7K507]
MTLQTKVEGDPGSIRSTAEWLGTMSGRLDEGARLTHQAGTGSKGGWDGPASEGFRSTVEGVRPRIAAIADEYDDVKGKLNAHADALSSVKKDMERAKTIATDAGLTVTGDTIHPPKKPPSPEPLGDNPSRSERTAHREAEAAVTEYNDQEKAYKDAAEIVRAAREEEDKAIENLKRFLNVLSRNDTIFTGDLTSGLAGAGFAAYANGAGRKESKFRGLQNKYETKAATARAKYDALRNQRINRFRFVKRLTNSIRQGSALASAQTAAQRAAGHGATANNYAAKASKFAKVGKAVPFVGAGIAVLGGINDYTSGRESAAQAATSTGGGILAGAATGAVIGTAIPVPVVGTAVGAIVGAGVGLGASMAIDANWDSISSGAEAVADGAKDVVSSLNPFD